ncbi:MAG: MATE family efflux transporter [Clostridia bacterium]|nr:MATE family efflux transporter [Clostridia bacterium]
MAKTTDMTKGKPLKLILNFALPLILTNLGQQLYMIADAAIVGRGIGVKALASVGAADWVYWMVLWTVMMLTQGFSMFVSRHFGEKNMTDMNRVVAMSTELCAFFGVILTVAGLFAVRPVLNLLGTPGDITDGSATYLNTMISGTVIVCAYNMASAILRAVGDGKTPLVAMIISAVLNVGLDLLFVVWFNWGIFGAAFASVISQLFSFLYCFAVLAKSDYINISKEMWKPDGKLIRKLLAFALPLAAQYMIINLGGIVLQSTVNSQGSMFVAGFTATNKLYGLLESSAISLGTAFSTYFAQNFGAKNELRIKRGMKTAILLSLAASLVIMLVVFVLGRFLLMLFLDTSEPGAFEALDIAEKYLMIMALCLPVLYLIYVYRSVLQSAGNSTWSLISGFGELFVRAGMAKIVFGFAGVGVLYWTEPLAWLAALLFVMIPYYIKQKRKTLAIF